MTHGRSRNRNGISRRSHQVNQGLRGELPRCPYPQIYSDSEQRGDRPESIPTLFRDSVGLQNSIRSVFSQPSPSGFPKRVPSPSQAWGIKEALSEYGKKEWSPQWKHWHERGHVKYSLPPSHEWPLRWGLKKWKIPSSASSAKTDCGASRSVYEQLINQCSYNLVASASSSQTLQPQTADLQRPRSGSSQCLSLCYTL